MADLQTTYISDLAQGSIQDSTLFITDDGTNTNSATATDVAIFAKNKILPEANSYADTKKNEAVEESKGYTHNVISNNNKCVNGCFQKWTRGTSFINVSTGYYADCWYNLRANTNIKKIDNTSDALCQYAMEITRNIAGNIRFTQPIENFSILEGETLTISFYAKSVQTENVTVGIDIGNKTAGTVQITSNWKKFSLTVEDITINTSYIYMQGVYFYANDTLNAGDGIDITGIKLELGKVATKFNPSINEDIECFRYFYKASSQLTTPYSMIAISNKALNGTILFPQIMRIKPTISELSLRSNSTGTIINITSFSIQGDANGLNAIYNIVGDSELVIGQWYTIMFEADAEIY